jgi:hypothetical protein
MTSKRHPLIFAILLMAAMWVFVTVFASYAGSLLGNPHLVERFQPFAYVHMAEEMVEGSYTPIHDIAFLTYASFSALLVAGVPALFLAHRFRHANNRLLYVPALLCFLFQLPALLTYKGSSLLPMYVETSIAFSCLAIAATMLASTVGRKLWVQGRGA